MYDDMAYNAVVVFLFKAAILERNVRHRHDLSENIVIDVQGKAVLVSYIVGAQVMNVVYRIPSRVAHGFGQRLRCEAVSLDICRTPLDTGATCGRRIDNIAHRLRV